MERTIHFGEEIPGALFYGVPSGKGKILSLETLAEDKIRMEIGWDNELFKYIDKSDQVCVNGVLLQIKDKVDQSIFFELYPETLKLTKSLAGNTVLHFPPEDLLLILCVHGAKDSWCFSC